VNVRTNEQSIEHLNMCVSNWIMFTEVNRVTQH